MPITYSRYVVVIETLISKSDKFQYHLVGYFWFYRKEQLGG